MRPANKEGPGLADPDLPKRIATTTFQNQIIAGGEDTAQASLEEYRQTLAERARDTGTSFAMANDAEFVELVLDWLYDLAPGVSVSADDVRREFGSSSAMGSIFRTAGRRGVLQKVEVKESTAVSRHKGLHYGWRRT